MAAVSRKVLGLSSAIVGDLLLQGKSQARDEWGEEATGTGNRSSAGRKERKMKMGGGRRRMEGGAHAKGLCKLSKSMCTLSQNGCGLAAVCKFPFVSIHLCFLERGKMRPGLCSRLAKGISVG
jgi:hypothetical protein